MRSFQWGWVCLAVVIAGGGCSDRHAAGPVGPADDGGGDTDGSNEDIVRADLPPIDVPPRPPAVDVDVIITADNAYGFGYGTEAILSNYFGGVENISFAHEIFGCPVGVGPESYTVPGDDADVGDYLYIVAYADDSTTQGVIAEFRRGSGPPVFTGHGDWEVCATGQDFDPTFEAGGGPTVADINARITDCNAGTLPEASSGGWVDSVGTERGSLQVGEDNTTERMNATPGNEFPIVCEIDGEAKWMWFNWDPMNLIWPAEGSPFIYNGGFPPRDEEARPMGGMPGFLPEPPRPEPDPGPGPMPGGGTDDNPDWQFLIFRLAAEVIII